MYEREYELRKIQYAVKKNYSFVLPWKELIVREEKKTWKINILKDEMLSVENQNKFELFYVENLD